MLSGPAYAAIPGARPLELDLYLPTSDDPAPVALFLHGGSRVGSRHAAGPAYPGSAPFERLAQSGIAVAAVDYQLSGEATWPAQLHDVKAGSPDAARQSLDRTVDVLRRRFGIRG